MVLPGQPAEAQLGAGLINDQQPALLPPVHGQRPCHRLGVGANLEVRLQRVAALTHQSEDQRNYQRLLFNLAGGGGSVLADVQLEHALITVPMALDLQDGSPGLVVPTPELGKIDTRCIVGVLHRLNKVVAGGG